MFVITKLVLETQDVQLIGCYDDIKSAKAKIHDLNENDQVSYRDNKRRFFKVYRKGFFGEYPIFIYKILEVPPIESENEY